MSVWAGLIERLERLVEPDREIDAEIAAALEVVPEFDRSKIRQDVTLRFVANDGDVGRVRIYCDASTLAIHGRAVPPYTSSLDAALTLVPKGYRVENLAEWDDETLTAQGPWMAQVRPRTGKTNVFASFADGPDCMHAPTPAIALCIAAIKARVSHGVDEPG